MRLLEAFRSGDWLSAVVARTTAWLLLAASLFVAAGWLGLWQGRLDLSGRSLGLDFTSFWSAAKLTLAGRPAAAYDPSLHHAQQVAILHHDAGYSAFFYPPVYLLICAPLALLPYMPSYMVWLAASGAAYWRMAKAWLGDAANGVAIFAFPGVLLNAGHGQNGFLTAALFGAGAGWLKQRPILAGVCLGALCFKPHLGLVIPLSLIIWGRWRVFAAAAATVSGLAGLSLAAFGPAVWSAFLANSGLARAALEQGLVGYPKMQSLFSAMRLWGGPVWLAYAAQAMLIAAVIAGLVWLRRRNPESDAEGAALIAAALLATPFLLDYDLVILAAPMAWLLREGRRTSFLGWEKTVLGAAYMLPLVSRALATQTHLALAPFVLSALFVLILRRGASVSPSLTRWVATELPGRAAPVAELDADRNVRRLTP